jgi:hypothetical protein
MATAVSASVVSPVIFVNALGCVHAGRVYAKVPVLGERSLDHSLAFDFAIARRPTFHAS